MDIVLQNGTDHSALSGNATIPVTGDERVSINDLTLDPTTGRFSTTATSTITQRDFVAGATVKTYSNLTLQAVGRSEWGRIGDDRWGRK